MATERWSVFSPGEGGRATRNSRCITSVRKFLPPLPSATAQLTLCLPACPCIPSSHRSGRKVVEFANGTRKVSYPDGRLTICFSNGDVKAQRASGRVDYYYAEVGTWHSTHGDGVEVFFFPAGQTEAHHPGGLKEIVFVDGHVRQVLPDGTERDVSPSMLSSAVRQPVPHLDEE